VTATYSGFITTLQKSPINISFQVANSFQNYRSGIYSPSIATDCAGANYYSLNHAMVAVGYGVQGSTQYAIIRNQWGTWWGEQGYARVELTKDNVGVCGLYLDNYVSTYGY
jgi:C1A family cysteine protease